LVGRHGAMNPTGSVRCNIVPIAKGYSGAFQTFFVAPFKRPEHGSSSTDAVSGR